MTTQHRGNKPANLRSEDSVNTAVKMLVSIVETACEHESDLELMRLVNFMDLYRTYLAHAKASHSAEDLSYASVQVCNADVTEKLENSQFVNFEYFISDSRLLKFAAEAASRECGIAVAVPPPLKLSANSSVI